MIDREFRLLELSVGANLTEQMRPDWEAFVRDNPEWFQTFSPASLWFAWVAGYVRATKRVEEKEAVG